MPKPAIIQETLKSNISGSCEWCFGASHNKSNRKYELFLSRFCQKLIAQCDKANLIQGKARTQNPNCTLNSKKP